MNKIIEKIDFDDLDLDLNNLDLDFKNDYSPVLLVIDNQVYNFRITKEQQKKFINAKNKTNYGFNLIKRNIRNAFRIIYYIYEKNYYFNTKLLNYINKPTTSSNIVLFKNDVDVFSLDNPSEWIKFTNDLYLKSFDNGNSNTRYLKNLLVILKRLINNHNSHKLKIYVSNKNDIYSEDYDKELNKLENKYRNKSKKYYIKSASRFNSYIERNIFNDEEKLLKKVNKQFNEFKMIGDIVLDKEELSLLNNYIEKELKRYVDLTSSDNYRPKYPKMFALGLVKFGEKYYKQNGFWKYFKDEYGISIPSNNGKQTNLIDKVFKNIMLDNNKIYVDDKSDYIHNVIMQSFVSDYYAKDLFDYLFDYWAHDLSGSINNLYKLSSKDFDNDLIDSMINTNPNSDKYIKLHTSMAIANNKAGSKVRIRHIIKLIDDIWYNNCINDNSRIGILLNKWKDDPKSAYLKEFSSELKKSDNKISKTKDFYHKPILKYDFASYKFIIKFPLQRLKDLVNVDNDFKVYWKIENITKGLIKNLDLSLYKDHRGYYANSYNDEYIVNDDEIFDEFRITLCDSTSKKYNSYKLNSDEIRMFDNKDNLIEFDYKNVIINPGKLTIFTKVGLSAYVIGKENDNYMIERNNMNQINFNLNKGDVLILPDNKAVQIGVKIDQGLIKERPIENLKANIDNKEYDVYRIQPHYLFKSKKENLNGVKLMINDKLFNLDNEDYTKCKLNDSVEEKNYGYIIDLKQYINNNGLYKIDIKIPGEHINNFSEFVYLKDFSFSFDKDMYKFEDKATLILPKEYKFNFNINDDSNYAPKWDEEEHKYIFYIMKEKDKENKVNLELLDLGINLSFNIPALFWKFKNTDDWNCLHIDELPIKDVPNKIYLKLPYEINGGRAFIEGIEEEYVKLKKEKDNVYSIDLLAIICDVKDCRDNYPSEVFVDVNLTSENNIHLFQVLVKSKLLGKGNLLYGESNNILIGQFNIKGNNTYSVSIKYNNDIIAEDIELKNGQFKYEFDNNLIPGKYLISIIEHEVYEDDDDIFDNDFSIEIVHDMPMKLVDLNNLENESLLLLGLNRLNLEVRDLNWNIYHYKYYFSDLKKINVLDYISDKEEAGKYVLWNKYNREHFKEYIGYTCTMKCRKRNDIFTVYDKMLLLFKSNGNLSDTVFINFEDELANDRYLLFDSENNKFMKDKNDFPYNGNKNDKLRLFKRYKLMRILSDDNYSMSVEVEG